MTVERALIRQLGAFGVVGLVGLIVDVGVFNVLRATLLSPDAVSGGVLIAKTVSTLAAIVVNWVGNRMWSFAGQRTVRPAREFAGFLSVSLLGMIVPLVCLWISHYALGLTSVWADNVSTSVVGLILGAALRFVLYRRWVFTGVHAQRVAKPPALTESAG
ncbi:GtrA family protein [Micrococcus luteus]|uniref:GtrA family protein n=1 Tax=Micrococcus luteus TaxID=1270 RepID=UPI0011A6A737|nr:GtrA family protein [Micrococcus luteus]